MFQERNEQDSQAEIRLKPRQLAMILAVDMLLFIVVFIAGVRVGQNMSRPTGPLVTEKKGIEKPALPSAESEKEVTPELPREEREPSAPALVEREEAKVPSSPGRVEEPAWPTPLPSKEESGSLARQPEARFAVQVSAHKEEEAAQKVVNQLRAKGFEAFITSADIQGKGRWYRVRIGPFSDSPTAQQMASQVSKALGQGVMVVPF